MNYIISSSSMNMSHHSIQSELNLKEPDFWELNFCESTANKLKLTGFLFQHIILELALPLALYFTLKPDMGELNATIISSVPCLVSILWTIVVNRRFEPNPIILLVTLAVGLTISLTSNNPRLNQIQLPVVTGTFGIICLVTLGFKKPILYYFSKPWQTFNNPQKIREFDQNWQTPNFRKSMKILSIIWGIGLITQAIINFILIFKLNNLNLVIIANYALTFGTIGLLVTFAVIYMVKMEKELIRASVVQIIDYRL